MDIALFSLAGVEFLLRWIHFLAGVTWIGLLYYFNFVQGEWFKEVEASVKSAAIRGLVPRALWWFRWGAMVTFLSGVGIILFRQGPEHSLAVFNSSWGILIIVGALLGTLMFVNVWGIIWPNQKVVIASANQVASGGAPIPEVGEALAKAGLASRSNLLFSIPMLFFMGAASHLGLTARQGGNMLLPLVLVGIILLLLEWNAVKGKVGPLTTINGAITCGILLTAVLYGILEWLY